MPRTNDNKVIAPRHGSEPSDRPWPVIRRRLTHGMRRLSRRMKVSLRTGLFLFLLGLGLPLAVLQFGLLPDSPVTAQTETADDAVEEEAAAADDTAAAAATKAAEPTPPQPAKSTTVETPVEEPDQTAAYAQSDERRRAQDKKSATSDEYERRLETLRVLEGR